MNIKFNVTLVPICTVLLLFLVACASSKPTIESRLTPGRILDDQLLTEAIQLAIRKEFRRQRLPYQINTVVLDGRVFLIGSVQTQDHKALVSDMVGDFRHVKSIHNELHVGKFRTAAEGNRDRTTATTARLALVNDPRTRAQELRLYVHKGTIYLIGITPRSVGSAAADLVKYVRGVQTVMLLIDYLD